MPETTDPNLSELRQALGPAYDIEAPIARGGMGFVYLARDRRLDRRVAVKVLPPDLAVHATWRQRFVREARTAAALTHPNIVPIFAVDEAGPFVFFAMAFVAGETLSQRVAAGGPLTPDAVVRLLRDIGEALAYAHARGVVHRDVKPDNILLDAASGRALLSDFGIAHVSPEGRPGPAPSGPVLGTAAFMSPEQARGAPVDARSDLYSLGVVAYYALSGRLPFHAATDLAVLALHIAEPAPPVATVAPSVPPRLAHVVDRCLAKDPWARYPDAAALVHAVAEAVEPPPAPLAVRAFLVRSKHLAGPARILPAQLAPLLPPVVGATAGLALLAAIAARRRTEQRIDPSGERKLRFWRGWPGRVLFRLAGVGRRRPPPIVTILGRLETPA